MISVNRTLAGPGLHDPWSPCIPRDAGGEAAVPQCPSPSAHPEWGHRPNRPCSTVNVRRCTATRLRQG